MEYVEYYKGKRKIRLFHSIGLVVMLVISFIAYPYVDATFIDAVKRGTFDADTVWYAKYFMLFAMPIMPATLIFLSLIIPVSDAEKAAQGLNLPRFIPINMMLVFILVVGHIGMQLFVTLPKDMFHQYAESISSVLYALMALLMLWVANITAKNTKSLWSGFPTPWNQKSELAWEKSQRFMGFGLAINSLICLVMAFIWPMSVLYIFCTGMAIAYGGCFIVSYYAYKQEQHYLNKPLQQGDKNDRN
ncbi:MAG: SdpI family protein [Alphaproteobacteria bacterium]|nr:SdpI family protein [Alphaproteobacteria bacterium]